MSNYFLETESRFWLFQRITRKLSLTKAEITSLGRLSLYYKIFCKQMR
ncbi:hypothetical protein S7335_4347 [Synechococcus sp. PCC 7335]|nr:hypothetical protein S7335_4347 [Synechococcus sp. PCC 7335]